MCTNLTSEQIACIIQAAITNRTPVKLRDGSKAFVTHDAGKLGIKHGSFPISGRSINNTEITWTSCGRYNGEYYTSQYDIVGKWVDLHPLENMPKDHPIYVRDAVYQDWVAGHFSNLQPDSEHPIRIYFNGKTSITGVDSAGWKEYRLPTADELKGTAWEGSKFVAE